MLMPDPDPLLDPSELRRRALSRWDNEGGALPSGAQGMPADVPDLTNAELVQLRIRVIALENLLIAVLAEGSDRQLQTARDMAGYISPRPGFTPHLLTIQAAGRMTDLVERAVHFRTLQSS
jgi:hypothetical protein